MSKDLVDLMWNKDRNLGTFLLEKFGEDVEEWPILALNRAGDIEFLLDNTDLMGHEEFQPIGFRVDYTDVWANYRIDVDVLDGGDPMMGMPHFNLVPANLETRQIYFNYLKDFE